MGDTHILFYLTFCSFAFGGILLVLNQFNIMFSPLSCYVPSDRVHEIIAVRDNLSKDFSCHPGEIHIQNDVLSLVGNTILYIFTIGPVGLFLKLKEGKQSMEKIVEDFEEERMSVLPTKKRGSHLPTENLPMRRRNA